MQRLMMRTLCVLSMVFCAGAQCVGDIYGGSDATDYEATLSGDREVPPVDSDGTGSGIFTLDEDAAELSFDIMASGLSGPVTAAHFHNAFPNQSGPIVFDIGDTIVESDGVVEAVGVWPLSEADLEELRLGYIYVNFHTAQNPSGEIRGNLTPVE